MAHIHEKIDFTTSVYVVHENKVLLHLHKKLNKWLPPGGHIELDEDPIEAALREVKEETGLDVELLGGSKKPFLRDRERDLLPPRFLNRHFFDDTESHEHVDLVYFARCSNADARPEEGGGEVRWFTKEQIEDGSIHIIERVRMYALAALDEVAQ